MKLNKNFIYVGLFIALLAVFVFTGSALAQEQVSNNSGVAIQCLQGGNCAKPATGLLKFLGDQNQTWLMLTVAGLVDGINPCAIGTLILLLGYLMVFAKKEKMMLPLGSIYILTIFVTYFLIGVVFSSLASKLLNWPAYPVVSQVFKVVVLAGIAFAGVLNLKDFFWYQKGWSLGITKKQSGVILKYLEKINYPTVIILGVLVTLFELPCSLPIYIGSVTILTGLFSWAKVLGYLLWYNFMFIVPILIVFLGLLYSKRIFEAKDWQERSNKYMKLMLGLSQVGIAVALYFL